MNEDAHMIRYVRFVALLALAALTLARPAFAADADAAARTQAMIDKGLVYLKSQQKPDGSWQAENEPPAMTAIVLKAFVQDPPKYKSDTDFVKRGFDKLFTYQMEDGGIYKDTLANYNTAIALSALAAANNPAFKGRIDGAVAYLKGLQWTDKLKFEHPDATKRPVVKDENDVFYGGWGYGGLGKGPARPDLSNAQITIEALKEAGLKESDPAFQNALKFVTRLQNNSETNPAEWAGDDGGFVYGPGNDRHGESMAGEYVAPDGKRMLRSYGSMTYAGLKSMIYAGLTKDDPRVKAAWEWVTKNWTLDENPGFKLNKPDASQSGIYYYYHTMAKALNAYDSPTITDSKGKTHEWRLELIDKLASVQKPDGSWTGEKRFMEDKPVLVTAYTVLALEEVREDLKQHPPK
jgi:squalene-hopene/tetraprenyl-beta-curcumene cyclase